MPINNIPKYIENPTKYRKFVTHLNKAGVLLPVILLEGTVTGGRTYQAYKRGGYTEARERFCEETTGAVFWLGGVKAFNAFGDWIGKRFLGIEEPKFSLAKDAVRKPFENMLRDKNLKSVEKRLVTFKFTKVAAAVVAAGGTLGFIVPKINQAITRKLLKADKNKAQSCDNNMNSAPMETMDSFAARTKHNGAKDPSFGRFSIDKLATLTNNLENHDVYKLLATDTGVLSGRAANARNKDERIEILVRDLGSLYFYYLCKDNVIGLLRKCDGFGGKLSALDPMLALKTHNQLVKVFCANKKPDEKISLDELKRYVYGSNPKQVETDLAKIKFKNGNIIALADFEALAKEAGVNVTPAMLKKAERMSMLQPERNLSDLGHDVVGRLLTKQQVKDVLSDSIVSRATFVTNVMKDTFDGALTERYKFVSQKSVDALRADIDNYVQAVVEYMEKNSINEFSLDLLKKINKTNLRLNSLHIFSGLGVSALFLSTLIPKFQYWVTKMRTGSDGFPGVKDLK